MNKIIAKVIQKIYTLSLPVHISTSSSDNQAYPSVCLQASNDYRVFNNFRRNAIYNKILEHVSEKQGREYLDLILKDADIFNQIDKFKENDKYGNPRMYEYPSIGFISPTTLRYIKVISDLKYYFKTLDNLSISEIGVGYGGQCRIINAYFKPASYCLVDLKPVLMLVQRFLDNYIIHPTLTYKTMNELERRDYDIIISNYAFTELNRSIQDVYLDKIILHTKRGYITYNENNHPELNSYKKAELIRLIPNAKIVEEKPLTHPKNCIIIWGANA